VGFFSLILAKVILLGDGFRVDEKAGRATAKYFLLTPVSKISKQ
jgi:hypothetical protein